MVEGSDWPDARRGDSPLSSFLDWMDPSNGVWHDFGEAKKVVEIWGDVLKGGGDRAYGLREILEEMALHHSTFVKLLWFGDLAHHRAKPVPGPPVTESLELVRAAQYPELTFLSPHRPLELSGEPGSAE